MLVVVALLSLFLAACNSGGGSPTTPSDVVFPGLPSSNSSPVTVVPPAPGPVLSIAMPIDGADIMTNAFGLLPFGYHGADHAGAGHSGWDIEYRLGASVRAAAGGVVQAIEPDIIVLGRSRVTIEHALGAHIYRTVYANLSSVREEIVLAAAVVRGQPIGAAGTVTATIAGTPVTYAMSHFQVDDFETHREGLDPKAVSPEPFLNAEGRAIFDRIWPRSVFAQELTEPFVSMSRDQRFPTTRTWRLESGDGPAGLSFTRTSAVGADHQYLVLTPAGTAIESGAVTLRVLARPVPAIDLVTPTGPRLGLYDIVGDQMRLALGSPGAPRPADLGAASVYRTSRPVLSERVSRNARGTRVEGPLP
jgi:hypothetical protein